MKRAWTVEVDPAEADRDEALGDAIAEAARAVSALDRLGGTLIVSALRAATGDSIGPEPEYVTVGYVFTWDSYAPGIPAPAAVEPEPAEQQTRELEPIEPELEPEVVG